MSEKKSWTTILYENLHRIKQASEDEPIGIIQQKVAYFLSDEMHSEPPTKIWNHAQFLYARWTARYNQSLGSNGCLEEGLLELLSKLEKEFGDLRIAADELGKAIIKDIHPHDIARQSQKSQSQHRP